MKRYLLCGASFAALLSASSVKAADIAPTIAPTLAPSLAPTFASTLYDWNGFYAGLVAGAAWGTYDTQTSTSGPGPIRPANQADVNAAGIQAIKPIGFATGIEAGYNWRFGNWLFGLEADLQAMHLNGETDTGAVHYVLSPQHRFTITAYGNTDGLLTARPRLGVITANNWLLYVTGGVALTQLRTDFNFDDDLGREASGWVNKLVAGYAVGGGVEAPLTDRLSAKIDYLHVAFPNTGGAEQGFLSFPADQVFTQSSSLSADIVRAGLNYRFGGRDPAGGVKPIFPTKAPPLPAATSIFQDWQLEAGARLWSSRGTFGGPQPLFSDPPANVPLASRLIYSNLDALSGETFARADHTSGFFVKGNLGAGGIYHGAMHDEDFPAGIAYSNTVSTVSGSGENIGYATIDVGYNVLEASGAKVGAFVGYNYYSQDINVFGCTQLAGGGGCTGDPGGEPPNLLTLTDHNQFSALRVGLSSQAMLTDRLRLTADAAYLPWVNFSGLDDHLQRQLLNTLTANSGNGVMLEAILDYYVAPQWSVGAGGRYWAWNMRTGTIAGNDLVIFNPTVEPARYNAERYGAFVQTSYHWGDSAASSASHMPSKAPPRLASQPMDWTGLYVGGHLGGGVSEAQWSDPFPTGPSGRGGTNVAGFGDSAHATGALGGGDIGANVQAGQLVLGAQLDGSLADLRGENTCFTGGLGGLNCQHIVNGLGAATGRLGYAWDRSLAYIKAGGAWVDTTYNLIGDTNNVTLGRGSTSMTTWGWTAGVGIEYALSNHWTTFAEYDHIGLPAATVPFPTVAIISTSTIGVSQSIDLFKMGVNYKIDLGWSAVVAKN